MATVLEMTDALADILSIDRGEAQLYGRRLRESGILPASRPGSGEGGKPIATSRHAANLLMALLVAKNAERASDALAFVGRTRLLGTTLGKTLETGAASAGVYGHAPQWTMRLFQLAGNDASAAEIATSLIADFQAGESRSLEPIELSYWDGRPGATDRNIRFVFSILYPAMGEELFWFYTDPEEPPSPPDAQIARRRATIIPGGVFQAIADFLGPLSVEEKERRARFIEERLRALRDPVHSGGLDGAA